MSKLVKKDLTHTSGRKPRKSPPVDTIRFIHVITGPGNTWSVLLQGRLKALRTSLSKGEAMAIAKKVAIKQSADFIAIHDKNAEVVQRIAVPKPARAS